MIVWSLRIIEYIIDTNGCASLTLSWNICRVKYKIQSGEGC